MTMQTTQAILLRDGDGTFYLISQQAMESGRVPDSKKQALEQAISSDVSGYLFNANTFQNAFAGLTQGNTNVGNNTVIGGFVGLNNQSLSQLGVNIGTVGNTQVRA